MTVSIVIVDDDMDDILLLNEVFATTEFANDILFFNNPEGLIPFLDSAPQTELPSLIITDLNMPKLSGFELLQELKSNKRYQHIPVIICTTSNSEKEEQKASFLGAHDFITKPIQKSGYYVMIEKIKALLSNGA